MRTCQLVSEQASTGQGAQPTERADALELLRTVVLERDGGLT